MRERWTRLEEWLAENAPGVRETLREPATESEIDDVEREIGMKLPPSVRESYRIHDGEASGAFGLFGCWRILPLTEVVDEHEFMVEIERKNDFGDWDPETMIPLLKNGGGDFKYVEHAPNGEETPVIDWWHDEPIRDVQAPSFAAYVDDFLADLADDQYVYVEADKALVHVDDAPSGAK